jgi:hypothetical protein
VNAGETDMAVAMTVDAMQREVIVKILGGRQISTADVSMQDACTTIGDLCTGLMDGEDGAESKFYFYSFCS